MTLTLSLAFRPLPEFICRVSVEIGVGLRLRLCVCAHCRARAGVLQVNYRETITTPAKFDYTHKKQSGGAGQFGKITGVIEPLPAAESGEALKLEFVNKLVGTDIPSVFVPSIEKGFDEAMASGNLTGHPVQVRRPHQGPTVSFFVHPDLHPLSLHPAASKRALHSTDPLKCGALKRNALSHMHAVCCVLCTCLAV